MSIFYTYLWISSHYFYIFYVKLVINSEPALPYLNHLTKILQIKRAYAYKKEIYLLGRLLLIILE